MRKLLPILAIFAAPVFLSATGPSMEVLVNGVPLTEYAARGTTYIEALKNQGYEIRLRNPYGVRVAVALSVDGLNTLDARHSDAKSARKWVLDPYETIVLRGWQTGNDQARRFFFTSEEKSYGAWLGKTENLGVISAVFFRERAPWAMQFKEKPSVESSAPAQPAPEAGLAGGVARDQKAAKDELAATGMGQAERHSVTLVSLNLEDSPAAVVTIRYEYRDALVALGVLPASPSQDALRRREKSQGFTEYCPTPR